MTNIVRLISKNENTSYYDRKKHVNQIIYPKFTKHTKQNTLEELNQNYERS